MLPEDWSEGKIGQIYQSRVVVWAKVRRQSRSSRISHESYQDQGLLSIDLEIDICVGPAIELTDSFSVAFMPFVLSINLVVDILRELWEAVAPILANDVGFNSTRTCIREVNDRTGNRGILMVQHAPSQKTSRRLRLLSLRGGQADQEQHHRYYEIGLSHGILRVLCPTTL